MNKNSWLNEPRAIVIAAFITGIFAVIAVILTSLLNQQNQPVVPSVPTIPSLVSTSVQQVSTELPVNTSIFTLTPSLTLTPTVDEASTANAHSSETAVAQQTLLSAANATTTASHLQTLAAGATQTQNVYQQQTGTQAAVFTTTTSLFITQPTQVAIRATETELAGPTATRTASPTQTQTPRLTASRTPTPQTILATVNVASANLRSGPSINYPINSVVTEGQSLEVLGRTFDEQWIQVSWNEQQLWIATSITTLSLQISNIAIITQIPPSPIHIASPTTLAFTVTPRLTQIEFVEDNCNGYEGIGFVSGAQKYCAGIGTRGYIVEQWGNTINIRVERDGKIFTYIQVPFSSIRVID